MRKRAAESIRIIRRYLRRGDCIRANSIFARMADEGAMELLTNASFMSLHKQIARCEQKRKRG